MRCADWGFALALVPMCASAQPCRVTSSDHPAALVELFTSQGCSSCPPADRWLSRLGASVAADRVIALSWHVSYWNYLGWRDPFAREAFDARQTRLAGSAGGRVYTPQVFVGGEELVQWQDDERFAAAVQAANRRAPRAGVDLTVQWLPPKAGAAGSAGSGSLETRRLQASARWRGEANSELLLAIKRSGYLTEVNAGENRGSRLSGDHVVRAWAGPFRSTGSPAPAETTAELDVPDGPGQAELVALVQDARSTRILQAVQLDLDACHAGPAAPSAAGKPH